MFRQVVADVIGTDVVGVSAIYWVDRGTDKIQRSDLDGSNIQDLVTRPVLNNPVDIALDVSGGKMYWVDETTDKIQCSNIDGSSIEDLITTGLDLPSGIALDVSGGKIYWTDRGKDKIQRSNIDGSGVEDLVTTGLSVPSGIALDIAGGKMYWVDRGKDKIQRSNLDGSGVEDLIMTGLVNSWDVALDVSGGKMYWVDDGKVQRSNLDGSNVEDLITVGLDLPSSIALDIAGGKMYWVDRGTGKIQRSNLDGSDVEDLVNGLTTAVSIALHISLTNSGPTGTDTIALSPDFDGNGIVDSHDFSLLIRVWGYQEGQEEYEAKYDLDGDRKIGVEDFLIFIQSYGKRVKHAPVFMSRTYVTHFIDENTPGGEPIGSPITATDADGDMLTYSLSGTDVDLFVIDTHTGQIQTKEGIPYDYEYRTTYSVIVEVSDGQGGSARLLVIIKINDLKEPPSSPPSNFLVIPDDESLTVHYHAVPDEGGRPPVRGYHAEIRRGENGPWGIRKTIYGRTNTSVYYHHIAPDGYHSRILVNGQLYQVRVRAYNSDGASEWSAPVSGIPVYTPPKEGPQLAQFQGEGDMASADIDLSFSTDEGGRIKVMQAALPTTISQEEVEGVFVEIVEVEVSNAPDVPAHSGFILPGSSSLFDIELKVRVNNRNVNIGSALKEPVEICLPVPETISEPVLIYYDSSRKIWEMLGEQRVDGKVVCAFTDRLSLFGVGLKVESINSPPLTNGTIAAQTMTVGTSGTVDVSSYFRDPNNDALTYTAISSNENIATVSTTGSVITITPVSAGSVTITVTGSDGRLSVDQTFKVTVRATPSNNAPIATGQIYWMDRGSDKIQRSNLDGSGIEDLVMRPTLSTPVGMALDISGGKMYWIDEGTDKIQQSNLDGSNIQDLVTTGLDLPTSIALDVLGGKMYWSDRGTDKIQRSNLDGSSVEDLITTGLSAPVGIALDISGGKLYWVDNSTDKIQRSNLDGSSVEDLVTGVADPRGIALDVSGGKLYWVDNGADKIQRSNLDGSSVEDLITTGVTEPRGIALDVSGGKLYWVDNSADKIQRSNLDGSSVEDLITTGLTTPVSIVLDVISDQILTVETSGTVDVSGYFSDPDNDVLTYTAMSSDENIATVSTTAMGSVIMIMPVSAGSVTITVTASDGSASVQQIFNVIVVEPNNVPVFTSSATFNVAENSTAVGTVVADDADSEDSITGYTLTGGVDQAQFEITNGGVLSFKMAPNFEAPTDVLSTTPSNAASNNEYIVEVRAMSGTGNRALTATQTLTVTVTDVDTEAPGSPAAPTVSVSTLNSLTVSWTAPTNTGPAISAYDVRYILTSADETVDANWTEVLNAWTSGALTYTISSLTQNTSYDIQVRAKSDEGTSGWSASVSGMTSANNAPVITSVSSVSVSENSTAVVTVTATDADTDDTITGYAIVAGGDGSLFSIVSSTGVLSFQSAPDYESPADVAVTTPANAANNNEYIVTVSATGGTGNRALTAMQTITVTVTDVTEVPSVPAAPTVSASTLNSLTVSWSAPTNTGPAISAYDVRYILTSADETDDANWTEVADAWTSGALTYTISSLTQNTSYDIQVRAKSDEGTSGWSASVSGMTRANNAPIATGQIYWMDRGSDKIQRSNLDGSGVEDLVMRPTLSTPVGMALDLSGGKMYWIDEGTDKIQRSNLDGSSVEDVITTGLNAPSGIALDVSGGKMYWSDRGSDKIQRSNLDGSGVEDLITTGLSAPVGIALDISGGKMYWVDNGADKIQRSNLDGSSVEDLVTSVTEPRGIALDVSGGKLYWVDNSTDKIQRSNLDGSSVEDLITTGLTTPVSIVLDVISDQILTVRTSGTVDVSGYFSDPDNDVLTYTAMSSDENIVTVSTMGSVITITPVSAGSVTITVTASDGNANAQQSFNVVVLNVKMYWTDRGTDKIQRANIDGSSIEDLVSRPTLNNPVDIALDMSGGKMYWIDESTKKIQRSNLDGSSIEDLVTGLNLPSGIALDISGGKIYWMDRGEDKIQRSNLDGSSIEDLITTGLQAPFGIALDTVGGKMYWVDDGTNKIQRTNIELVQGETTRTIEDLITGLTTPVDLSLDISSGKMYWTDRGTSKIQRTDIELAQGETTRTIEDLVSVTDPRGIALDISGGKIYWTDNSTDKIQRSNLDGSSVENLITTGLTTPVSIALGF